MTENVNGCFFLNTVYNTDIKHLRLVSVRRTVQMSLMTTKAITLTFPADRLHERTWRHPTFLSV